MALELVALKKTYPKSALAHPKSTLTYQKSALAREDFSVSLDLSVEEGETLALVGPSGSGKTTTLNLIAGLEKADSGKVISNGEDISALPSWKRNVSVVFQDLALFPHLDVGGNIAYGLFIRKVPRKERQRVIEETLRIVRLPGYASRRIHTLSGGERQRVAIARSLASNPRALLLDEPFSSLDAPLRRELRSEFLEIRSHSKAPCVFVTHDREEAVMLGDRIALMAGGRIIESGTGRDLFLEPKTEFAAKFFGAGLVLPCKVIGKRATAFGSASVTEVSTPLGMMVVPSECDTPGAKLFIPNDAVRYDAVIHDAVTNCVISNAAVSNDALGLDETKAPVGWKRLSARCLLTFFKGQSQVVRLSLPAGEASESFFRADENCVFEITLSPRAKSPAPGSMAAFWVDQSLLRFVEAIPN